MNRENAHLYLPYVQALADGKTVQINHNFRHGDLPPQWESASETSFTLPPQAYRIKPEPREVWVVVNGERLLLDVCDTEEMAKEIAKYSIGRTYFRAVEVTQ